MNLYGFVNGTIPIAAAKSSQPLELAGGDNEWNGGLSDLGIWNIDLTAAAPENQLGSNGGLTNGTIGGETAALYFTPTSGFTALSRYGVGAMDKLFTLYDGQLRTTDNRRHRQRRADVAVRRQRAARHLGVRRADWAPGSITSNSMPMAAA